MSAIFQLLLAGNDLITPFQQRVAADSGTFEGVTCLRADLNELRHFYLRFGIIYTANAYKANKIYALKPTNGDGDLATVRATTATRRDSSGNIVAVSSGVPRLNTRFGYSCARQLTELTGRTNLLLRSEEFDNASWTKTNVTVSANAVVGPDGASTADSILETVTSGQHRVEQVISKATSILAYAFTFYIKPNGRDWIYVSMRQSTNILNRWYNITTGTVGSATTVSGGNTFTHTGANILDAGNGWFKVEMNCNSNNANSMTLMVASSTGNNVTTDFAGDTSKGFYIWGAQLEQAAASSSYIPTTSATVSRNAETITTKTGLSSYLGSSEGAIYFRGFVTFDSTDKRVIISDGTASNRIELIFGTNNKARVLMVTGGVTQADLSAPDVYRSDSELRVAIRYASNLLSLYVNGVFVATDTSLTVPSGLDRIDFTGTSQNFSGAWKTLAFSNAALTDAQAREISAPVEYPPILKNIIPLTFQGNPDYYGFGNGVNLNDFFTDYSIYLAKRGPSHYLDGGNGFGMLYNAKFNLWTGVFETIDDGTTYYSGHSAGIIGNQIFVQVSRYTVAAMVDTFVDIGYFTSVDLTTLSNAEDLKSAANWNGYTALPAPTYTRYEAYGKILESITTPGKYFGPWFEHNGTNHRLNIRKIIHNGVDNFTITNIQVHDSTNDYGEPSLVNCGGSNWLLFVRQNDGTEMIHLFSSTDDCETWTDVGDTNLGSSSGDCVIDTVFYNNQVHVFYQDRGNGFIMKSTGNTYAQCLTLTLNTPVEYHWNAFNDSLGGLGYPSIWEIRSGVFYATWIKESSTTEAHVYGTLTTI